MEIVNNSPNDGDTYKVNGITYYRRGAQITLKLKDNHTAAAITIGGETLDLATGGSYSTAVSDVTVTVSGISWRDPTMNTTFTITGLADSPIEFNVDESNNVTSSNAFFADGKTASNYFGYDSSTDSKIIVKQDAVDYLIANNKQITCTTNDIQFTVDSGVKIDGEYVCLKWYLQTKHPRI